MRKAGAERLAAESSHRGRRDTMTDTNAVVCYEPLSDVCRKPADRWTKTTTIVAVAGLFVAVAGLVLPILTFLGVQPNSSQTSSHLNGSSTSSSGPLTQSPSSPAPPVVLNRQWLGVWSGNVTQTGYGSYNAQITITNVGKFAGHSEYSSFPCNGDLDLRSINRHVLKLTEYITQGNCYNGQITLTIVRNNVAEYSWISSNHPNVTVSGTLSKT